MPALLLPGNAWAKPATPDHRRTTAAEAEAREKALAERHMFELPGPEVAEEALRKFRALGAPKSGGNEERPAEDASRPSERRPSVQNSSEVEAHPSEPAP